MKNKPKEKGKYNIIKQNMFDYKIHFTLSLSHFILLIVKY